VNFFNRQLSQPCDAEFSQARLQCCALHAQTRGGASWPTQDPPRFAQRFQNPGLIGFDRERVALDRLCIRTPIQFAQRHFQHGALGKNRGALDQISQLANVSRPWVRLEPGERLRRDMFDPLVHAASELPGEMMHQRGDVFRSFAQWWHQNREDVYAIIEISAKSVLFDHRGEIAVGGGNQTDIDFDGFVAADSFKLLFLEHAQQLGLQFERDVADLVEKQCAAVGDLETAQFSGRSRR
jgi:hypothetical protein